MDQIMKKLVTLFTEILSYFAVQPKMQPVRVRKNERR